MNFMLETGLAEGSGFFAFVVFLFFLHICYMWRVEEL